MTELKEGGNMKMNNLIKTILLIALLIFVMAPKVLALSGIISDAKGWRDRGQQASETALNTSKIETASSQIYNILLGVAVIAAVGVGAFLGIQFMTAGVDKRVEVKEALIPYIAGCVVVFGAFGIWKLAVNLISGVIK